MPLSTDDGGHAPWQRLAVANAHPRDGRVQFREADHTYAVDGDRRGWVSCTTLIHKCFPAFDADGIIAKMRASPHWATRHVKYHGLTDEQIKAAWKANGDDASSAGTRLHLDIEHYWNAAPVGNVAGDGWAPETADGCWGYFLDYVQREVEARGWVPLRTEWLVFDADLRLAGSVDMVYRKPDGTLAVHDWKRMSKYVEANPYQRGFGPMAHLPDTNAAHYALQQSVYAALLERHYGAVVSEVALVWLHPSQPGYRVLPVQRLHAEVDALFACRAAAVAAMTPEWEGEALLFKVGAAAARAAAEQEAAPAARGAWAGVDEEAPARAQKRPRPKVAAVVKPKASTQPTLKGWLGVEE
jgi:hypothetical protein